MKLTVILEDDAGTAVKICELGSVDVDKLREAAGVVAGTAESILGHADFEHHSEEREDVGADTTIYKKEIEAMEHLARYVAATVTVGTEHEGVQ